MGFAPDLTRDPQGRKEDQATTTEVPRKDTRGKFFFILNQVNAAYAFSEECRDTILQNKNNGQERMAETDIQSERGTRFRTVNHPRAAAGGIPAVSHAAGLKNAPLASENDSSERE